MQCSRTTGQSLLKRHPLRLRLLLACRVAELPALTSSQRCRTAMRPAGAASSLSEPVAEQADTPCSLDDYIFVRNLRLVRPYYFDFKCYVKKRWEGLTLVELFSQEFPMLNEEYYREAFRTGRLRVEGQPQLQLSSTLRTGMCIRHLIHRHEPPVLAGEVQVLGQTEEFVAVSKPACMPVHTVGQYRKNTVLGVLQAQCPELGHLYPTYRLDKPVSGLLLLARSSAVAGRMRKLLEERLCSKNYMARVLGTFPAASAAATAPGPAPPGPLGPANGGAHGQECEDKCEQTSGSRTEGPAAAAASASLQLPGVSVLDDGWLRVDVPLSWDPRTNHVSAVAPGQPSPQLQGQEPKEAVTEFRLVNVSPDGSTSVVECRPKTGRTHQIRVHLQYLGHAIANDSQYGGVYGPPLAFRLNQPVPVNSRRGPEGDEAGGPAKRPRHQPPAEEGAAAAAGTGSSAAAAEPPLPAVAGADVSNGEAPCSSPPAEQQQQEGPSEQPPQKGSSAPSAPAPPAALLPGAGGRDHQFNKQFSEAGEVLPETIRELYMQDCYRVEAALQDPVCPHCPCLVPKGYPIDLEPLWLHALAYSGPGWAFEAPPPVWAQQGFEPTRKENQTLDP